MPVHGAGAGGAGDRNGEMFVRSWESGNGGGVRVADTGVLV